MTKQAEKKKTKIRRIRYVEGFQVEDDNPYRDKDKPPRKFWRNWIVVDEFTKGSVVQIDNSHRYPGKQFQLRVPMTDPETGRMTDADGDTSLLRIIMVGGEVDMVMGYPTFKGFVSNQELAHEEAYRKQDLDGCLASYDEGSKHEYVMEEWQVIR